MLPSNLRMILPVLMLSAAALPAAADHGSAWATDDDAVNAQFHDANQTRSIDTPGIDEMRGNLERNVVGKTDAAPDTGRDNGGRRD